MNMSKLISGKRIEYLSYANLSVSVCLLLVSVLFTYFSFRSGDYQPGPVVKDISFWFLFPGSVCLVICASISKWQPKLLASLVLAGQLFAAPGSFVPGKNLAGQLFTTANNCVYVCLILQLLLLVGEVTELGILLHQKTAGKTISLTAEQIGNLLVTPVFLTMIFVGKHEGFLVGSLYAVSLLLFLYCAWTTLPVASVIRSLACVFCIVMLTSEKWGEMSWVYGYAVFAFLLSVILLIHRIQKQDMTAKEKRKVWDFVTLALSAGLFFTCGFVVYVIRNFSYEGNFETENHLIPVLLYGTMILLVCAWFRCSSLRFAGLFIAAGQLFALCSISERKGFFRFEETLELNGGMLAAANFAVSLCGILLVIWILVQIPEFLVPGKGTKKEGYAEGNR